MHQVIQPPPPRNPSFTTRTLPTTSQAISVPVLLLAWHEAPLFLITAAWSLRPRYRRLMHTFVPSVVSFWPAFRRRTCDSDSACPLNPLATGSLCLTRSHPQLAIGFAMPVPHLTPHVSSPPGSSRDRLLEYSLRFALSFLGCSIPPFTAVWDAESPAELPRILCVSRMCTCLCVLSTYKFATSFFWHPDRLWRVFLFFDP